MMPNDDSQIDYRCGAHIQGSISDEIALNKVIWKDIENPELFHQEEDSFKCVPELVLDGQFFLNHL
jgi:hypothetical protein